MLGERVRLALMIEMHRAIAESASHVISALERADAEAKVHYPPNAELSTHEREALRGLNLNPFALSAIKKLVRDAAAYPTFHLFTLLDGVGDPPRLNDGETLYEGVWKGLSLVPKEGGSQPMLHDEFYDTYRTFDRSRPDINAG